MSESNHITWHDSEVTKKQRQHRNGHKSAVIWFTGLSGSCLLYTSDAADE